MEGATEFRTDVESWLDSTVSPPDPASFTEALVESVQSHADDLAATVDDSANDDLRREVDEYVDGLVGNAAEVGEGLSDAQFGEFDVVFSALDFDYSWKIYQGRRILMRHDDDLDDGVRDLLEDVVRLLRFSGPARERFKTLYSQWELVGLSRMMLLSSVPAPFVAVGVQLYVNASVRPGATLGVEHVSWLLAACATLTLLPFLLLLSYVIRVATVTKRTLTIGSFILRETERSDAVDWE